MNKKLLIIFGFFLIIILIVSAFSKQRVGIAPSLFVYDAPETSIKTPDSVSYSFSAPPSYVESLPTYSISHLTVETVESTAINAFPLFKTATPSSLFRDDILTKTRASSTGDLTLTAEKQTVVVSVKEQGAATKTVAPPAIILTSLFSSMGLSPLIGVVQNAEVFDGIEGFLILDPKSTSTTGHTFSYKINGLPFYNPVNPGPPASSIIDNLGVLRSLHATIPPQIEHIEKSVPLVSPEAILENLRSGKGSIVSANNPDSDNFGGGVTFSSFVIEDLSIVYAETDTKTLSPAFLLHGYGSSNNSSSQEATFFLWATFITPTR